MKRLMEAKKRHNSKVNVVWNFLVMKQNEHQMDMARDRAKQIGVEITFSIMRTNLKDDILGKVEDNIENDAEWIPENPDYNPYDLEQKKQKNLSSFARDHGWKHSLTGMVMSFLVDV